MTVPRVGVLLFEPSVPLIDHTPENTLYFGCRSAEKDQHYRTEWEDRVRAGSLRYRLSCSRDGEEGKAKIYVQDLLEEDAESVWEILNDRKGSLYISG
jgi:sulfite reductase alpha subunit-like flavoprotein